MIDSNYYIYFSKDDKQSAEQLEKEVIELGFRPDLHLLDYDGGQWSLELNKQLENEDEVNENIATLERLAAKYGGEYDGFELSQD